VAPVNAPSTAAPVDAPTIDVPVTVVAPGIGPGTGKKAAVMRPNPHSTTAQ